MGLGYRTGGGVGVLGLRIFGFWGCRVWGLGLQAVAMFPSLRGVSWALGEKCLGFTFEVEVEAVLCRRRVPELNGKWGGRISRL